MTENPNRIVIELAPSDRFGTKSHAHLADIVRRRVTELIARDGMGTDRMVKAVRVEAVRVEAVPVRRTITVVADEDILHAAMSDLYNSACYKMVAEDGTAVTLVDGRTPCDECGERIPDGKGTDGDGSIFNKHHAESCSLYVPAKG